MGGPVYLAGLGPGWVAEPSHNRMIPEQLSKKFSEFDENELSSLVSTFSEWYA